MYYEIVNIAQQHKDGNIDASEAMETIISILFPPVIEESLENYIQRLVAFMFDINTNDIINQDVKRNGNENVFKAKCVYTKIMSYTKNSDGRYVTKTKLSGIIGVSSHVTAIHRLKQHDIFYKMDTEYKHIYDIVKKVLL